MKRLVVAGAGLLCACATILGPEATDPQSIYEELWTQFDRHYSYFEHKGIDWRAQGDLYRPPANASSTELFSRLTSLLRVLDDPHVELRSSTGTSQSGFNRARQRTFYSQQSALAYVSQQRTTSSGQMRFGTLSSRIGYVRIASFGGAGWGPEIDAALAQMPTIDALVIDVRDNGGGNNRNGLEIANRFADQARTVGYYRYRNGPSHSDFTAPQPIGIAPVAGRFDGPVAVLSNRRCASATEDFLMRMRAIPGVLVIGDTSMGAVGNPIQRELANGWSYQFSEWTVVTPDMKPVEDAGLAPSIVVPATLGDSTSAVDRALERAVAELTTRLSASPAHRSLSPP